jgi:hypothetical protein
MYENESGIHLDGLDRVDGVFEDWSFPRAFNLASDPKERWSVKKYPNLAAGQANDQPPRYGQEDPGAETGAEHVHQKLESLRQQ